MREQIIYPIVAGLVTGCIAAAVVLIFYAARRDD
jgi:hypothetical protein